MAKKSKSKKLEGKKTKAKSPEAKSETLVEVKSLPEAASPSWSTDDVYNLLKAVNEITLKRVENKIDALTQRVMPIDGQLKAIDTRLKAVQEQDLSTMRGNIISMAENLSLAVYPDVRAIKAKTDRLP